MLIANLDFTDEIVERIRVVVRGTANLTRCALSRMVCGWMDWHGFDGRAKEARCRAALLKLERRDVIELPPAREVSFESSSPAVAPPEPAWLRIKGAVQAQWDWSCRGQRGQGVVTPVARDYAGAPSAERRAACVVRSCSI
jgi:hypothetical protein